MINNSVYSIHQVPTSEEYIMKKLSNANKYAIADAIAKTYDSLLSANEGVRKATYASIINDAQFSVKGSVYTLQTFCNKDDVQHITRLIMRRLTQPSVSQRIVANIDEE